LVVRAKSAQASFFSGTKKILHSANLQAIIQAAGPTSSTEVFFQKIPA
jgi:hypothetical protein